MNLLVQLLCSLRHGFVTFCAMDPFKILVKSIDPFSQKCKYMKLITQTQTIFSITLYIIDCTTKETNYVQIHFSKY
jgi:hypothetical protein